MTIAEGKLQLLKENYNYLALKSGKFFMLGGMPQWQVKYNGRLHYIYHLI